MSTRWLAELHEDESNDASPVLYRIGRDGDERIAEWPGLASLRCSPSSAPIFRGEEGADPRFVAKVEAGLARALARSLGGQLTLHASAVSWNGAGVACLGASGAGKSTLARALCTAPHMSGARLIADDMTPLDLPESAADPTRVTILPSERAVWLSSPDGQMGKHPIDVPYASEPAPLVAIVTLAFDDGPTHVARLKPAALFAALVPSLVRFALDDPEAHAREMAALSTLCRVPAFALHRPRDLGALDDAVATLTPLFAVGTASYLSSR